MYFNPIQYTPVSSSIHIIYIYVYIIRLKQQGTYMFVYIVYYAIYITSTYVCNIHNTTGIIHCHMCRYTRAGNVSHL